MPIIDLSDEDAALLEAARKAGGAQGLDLAVRARLLHEKLIGSNDTARDYKAQIKKLFPSYSDPVDAAAAPYVGRLDAFEKRFDEFMTAQEKQRADGEQARLQSDFDTAWNGVVSSYSLTQEGEEKLLNFMKDRRLSDPEAAAALYYKQNPEPPAPIQPSAVAPQAWTLHDPGADEANTKLLMDSPESWADREAAATLTEIRRQAA